MPFNPIEAIIEPTLVVIEQVKLEALIIIGPFKPIRDLVASREP